MGNISKLSLIIPARNETARLPATLEKAVAYLSDQDFAWELIVVDNNSTDGTDRLVLDFAAKEPNLRLLKETTPGKGAAVKTGILAADGDMLLFSDADLSCPIAEEQKLRRALADGCDVAIASRRLPDSEVEKTLTRRLMSTLFNWLVQLLALPGIKDSQCGFKAFSRPAAQKLFTAARVAGFAFDVEILFLARKSKLRIVEVPVRWQQAEGSRVNALRDALRMVRDIIKFRYNWMRGAYRGRLEQDS